MCGTACSNPKDQAGTLARDWFVSELKRLGYVERGEGIYGTEPKAAAGLLLGDALEVQVRQVRVTAVREMELGTEDRQREVAWRGQAFLSYELREQYHRDQQPRGWSDWQQETSILSLELRAGQWYVTRVK